MTDLFPSEVYAGVDFSTRVELAAHPAPTWTVTAMLRGPITVDIVSTPDGEAHLLAATGATTSAWHPGRYWWQLRATADGDIVTVGQGETVVRPDMAVQPAGYDGRSHAQRVLDAIEAVIEGRATKDQASYAINNRQLSLTPIADLLMLRDRYRAEARRQRGSSYGRRVKVMM